MGLLNHRIEIKEVGVGDNKRVELYFTDGMSVGEALRLLKQTVQSIEVAMSRKIAKDFYEQKPGAWKDNPVGFGENLKKTFEIRKLSL